MIKFLKIFPPFNAGMLLLALFPILNYYASPLPFSWGEVLLLIYVFIRVSKRGVNDSFLFPRNFVIYWAYCALSIIVLSNSFNVKYLIPGGISMFIWCLFLGILTKETNNKSLLQYFRVIFIPIGLLFVAQEVTFYLFEDRISFHLPISSMTAYYGDLSFEQLAKYNRFSDRSNSLFMEPAYFAEYLLLHLCLEFFGEEGRNKLFNKYIIAIVLILLLLKSGTGLVGLAFLGTLKLISYIKTQKSWKSLALTLVLLPALYIGATYYVTTEIGSGMLKRQNELTDQSGSSYERIFRGLELYDAMPFPNKIIGIDPSTFRETSNYYGVETLKEGMLFNGFQSVLITKGLIGLLLLFAVYVPIYRRSNILTKSSLGLLLLLSWIESVYLMPAMLILTLIAFEEKKQYSRIKEII